MTTDELIQACQLRERAAQKELYEILLPYLNVVCRRYLNNATDLQDVLQDTFIKIFSKIDQYDSERSQFKTWAVKIAINCCLKSNVKTAKLITTQFVAEQHGVLVRPEILSKLSDQDLLAFFKTMPPKYFVVFNLNVIDGFSHKEIAALIGIDESLSRKRLSRARAWLQSKKGEAIMRDLGLRKLK